MALAKYYEDLLERQVENLNQMENSLNKNLEHNDLMKIKNQLMGDLRVIKSLVDDFMELIINPENSEIINLKNEIKRLQAICNEVNCNSYFDLTEKYNKLKEENDETNKKLAYKERKLNYIINEQDKAKKEIEKMHNQIKLLNDEIFTFSKMKNKYKKLNIEIYNKNEEIDMLYDEINKMEKMLEFSRNPKDIKEISLLRKENHKLLEKLSAISLDYQEKSKKLVQSNSIYSLEIKNKDDIIKNLENSIKSYMGNIKSLKNENNEKLKQISNLNAKIKKLEQDIIDVQKRKPRIISHKLNGEAVIREIDIVGKDTPTRSSKNHNKSIRSGRSKK